MNKFQSLCFGATLAATTMTTVALAPSSAMAITLNGSLVINGAADIGTAGNVAPGTAAIDWTGNGNTNVNNGVINSNATGDFSTLAVPGNSVTLKDLALTLIPGSVVSNGGITTSNYTFGSYIPFIDFGLVAIAGQGLQNLSFNLDPGTLSRTDLPTGIIEYSPVGITGTFVYGGNTAGKGIITAQESFFLSGGSGDGSVSITAVPEPITMGGLALGTAFGAFMRKRYAKNDAKLQKA
jgi:hypothetical protein